MVVCREILSRCRIRRATMKIVMFVLIITLVSLAGCTLVTPAPPGGTVNGTGPTMETSDSPPNPWDYRLDTYPDGSHKWIRINLVATPMPANWPNQGTAVEKYKVDSPANPWDYRLATFPDGSHKWIRINPVATPMPADWPNQGTTQ